jgi:hypothetical protein
VLYFGRPNQIPGLQLKELGAGVMDWYDFTGPVKKVKLFP